MCRHSLEENILGNIIVTALQKCQYLPAFGFTYDENIKA